MRIKRLQNQLILKGLDLALFFSLDEQPNTNVIYFSNYSGLCVLVVPSRKAPFMISPEMEYEKALSTGLKVYKTEKKVKLLEKLMQVLKKEKINKIGIEETKCSVSLFKKLRKGLKARYYDLFKICSGIRMVKDKDEIEKITKACSITDKIFKKIYSNFNYKTELQLKEFIESEISRYGCEPAFPPIVASGAGSSQPHYNSSKKIKTGFLLLDFGARYKGYCSDMTRMLYLGNPQKKEIEDYKLVLNTVLSCEKASESKKRFSELYAESIACLGDKSRYFIHSLGHGVGLDIHEAPSLSSEDKSVIQSGIVFTVEPGIYFPNKYGIRIEDTVILKNNKLSPLTKSRKDLIKIKNEI